MGDQAVRWALQQTQFSPTAQIMLVRICWHVIDKGPVWKWRPKAGRAALATECHTSEATVKRYYRELEGKDEDGKSIPGLRPQLFRGGHEGRSSELVIYGPKRAAAAAYILKEYAVDPAQVDPAQVDPAQGGSSWTRSRGEAAQVEPHPAQVKPRPAQVGPPIKDIEPSFEPSLEFSSPVHDSNPQQGREPTTKKLGNGKPEKSKPEQPVFYPVEQPPPGVAQWERILGELKKTADPVLFRNFYSSTRFERCSDNALIVSVPTPGIRQGLLQDTQELYDAADRAGCGREWFVCYIVREAEAKPVARAMPKAKVAARGRSPG